MDGSQIEANRLGLALSLSAEDRVETVASFRRGHRRKESTADASVSETGLVGKKVYLQFGMSREELRENLHLPAQKKPRGARDSARPLGLEVRYDPAGRPPPSWRGHPACRSSTVAPRSAAAPRRSAAGSTSSIAGLQVTAQTIASPRHGLRFDARRGKVTAVTLFADPQQARIEGGTVRNELRPIRLAWTATWPPTSTRTPPTFTGKPAAAPRPGFLRVPKAGGETTLVADQVATMGCLLVVADQLFFMMNAPLRLIRCPGAVAPACSAPWRARSSPP